MSYTTPLTASQILDCRRIIKKHPLFSALSSEDINELSNMFFAKSFTQGEVVVAEGDLIDCVYFIAQGKAEVRRNVPDTNTTLPIVTLVQNESIGLSDTGYYSTTGKRSATVIAVIDTLLFGINVRDLNKFITTNNKIKQSLKQYSHLLLRMNFIKQIAPFAEISVDSLVKYANRVQEITVPKNEIIFNQGDIGDKCYLICDGKVEILIINAENDLEKIATLESPSLFGETSLLIQRPRNATVRTATECRLLVIDYFLLSDMLKDTFTEKTLINLVSNRSRLLQNTFIECYATKSADGSEIYILKDLKHGKYCRLTKEGYFIWQQFDGKKSIRDVTNAYFDKYKECNPDLIFKVVDELSRINFLSLHEHGEEVNHDGEPSSLNKVFAQVQKVMDLRLTFDDLDDFFSNVYAKCFFLFFNKWLQFILLIFSFVGLYVFCAESNNAYDIMRSLGPMKWWLLVITFVAAVPILIMREFSRAMTIKHYGRKINSFSFGWYWFAPTAFCDTSDMWPCPRYPRVITDLSGIYTLMLIAAISSTIAFFIHSPNWQLLLWYISLYNYILIVWNLIPMLDFDGYFALMNWLDEPNLRVKAITLFGETSRTEPNHQAIATRYKKEKIYWLACLAYLFIEVFVVFFIADYLLAGLLDHINSLYSVGIALLVFVLTVILILIQFRKIKRELAANRFVLH